MNAAVREKSKTKTDVTVAQYLNHQLEVTKKTQKQIADECGWPKPNIITMFKQGTTRVPLASAPKLAKALEVDPARFLRLCMTEYMPEVLDAIENTLGGFVSKNEMAMIEIIRGATKDSDPALTNREQERELARFARYLIE